MLCRYLISFFVCDVNLSFLQLIVSQSPAPQQYILDKKKEKLRYSPTVNSRFKKHDRNSSAIVNSASVNMRTLTYGILTFKTKEAYDKALSTSMRVFGILFKQSAAPSCTINIEEKKSVFVSNIPPNVTVYRLMKDLKLALTDFNPHYDVSMKPVIKKKRYIEDQGLLDFDQALLKDEMKTIPLGCCILHFKSHADAWDAINCINQLVINKNNLKAGLALNQDELVNVEDGQASAKVTDSWGVQT